uniref:Photosystem I assembly protein Ycf4 n=1 Tax=Euglena hiemalis TaxID=392896 RepID=A0A345UC43_9EUGL|nr:photosystem I assembly protein ycf4 [Euglena hiemalis]AXI98029.1 photosystem I assembly protein ycf4 [Euglena hiemalis]
MNKIKDMNPLKNEKILREEIYEKNKITKWIYNIIILLGGSGFLIVGISSYIKYNIVYFLNSDQIIFFPQGIIMCFYGICAIIISINQIKITLNKAGEGYNEFNKNLGLMQIYRKGTKGKNSDINIIYQLTDIEAIKIEIKNGYFNSKQNILVCLKEKNDIPILQLTNPLKINELEKKASEIASFLNVPLKGS